MFHSQKITPWDFPGGPVVKAPPSNAGCEGLIPGWVTKIQHVVWCSLKVFLKLHTEYNGKNSINHLKYKFQIQTLKLFLKMLKINSQSKSH